MRIWSIYILVVLMGSFLQSCGETEVIDQTDRRSAETSPVSPEQEIGTESRDTLEILPPEIPATFLRDLDIADGFDYPVGPPNAENYYKARGFLPKGLEHLGEDWNGTGGRNTDFGDYVYAAADGVVFYAEEYNRGWGQVVRVLHNFGTRKRPKYVESLYAHMASSWVQPSHVVRRGEIIGTMGNAEGIYHAHLHFEMRRRPGRDVRSGYDGDTLGFLDPSQFIEAHRPAAKKAP